MVQVSELFAQIKRAQAEINRMCGIELPREIVVSDYALEDTDERLFPESRHRSRRIRKKLIKRFGGEFRKKPAIFKIGDKIIMHPVRYREMQASTQARLIQEREKQFMSSLYGLPVRGSFVSSF